MAVEYLEQDRDQSEEPLPADRYSDREMQWLEFNNRVLDLAKDDRRIPLIGLS